MQFPLLLAGRPFTGERAMIPGIKYPPEEKCFWTRHCPGDLEALPATSRRSAQLRLVGFGAGPPRGPADARPMAQAIPAAGGRGDLGVAGGQRSESCWRAPPGKIVASVFANHDLYIALANYGTNAVDVSLAGHFTALDGGSDPAANAWTVGPRNLLLLKKNPA